MPAQDAPPALIPAERQNFILAQLAREGVVSIARLTEALGVSHMTVRRDIRQLETEGRVTSVAGGVRLPERLLAEPQRSDKTAMMAAQKAAIGAVAAAMIPRGAVIYVDAGTTTQEIARRIVGRDDLTIVTNDFVVCATLGASRSRLYHTGGAVERDNQSCVGQVAAAAIARFAFDIAFISAPSWSLRGVTTPTEDKTVVKRAALDAAARGVLVADSAKYGLVGAFVAAPLTRLATLITDAGAPQAALAAARRLGVEVRVARSAE
ncbi:MAG: DeoR/GlpR family DNA-binding transcription regulator [Rubrimonas sp.]